MTKSTVKRTNAATVSRIVKEERQVMLDNKTTNRTSSTHFLKFSLGWVGYFVRRKGLARLAVHFI